VSEPVSRNEEPTYTKTIPAELEERLTLVEGETFLQDRLPNDRDRIERYWQDQDYDAVEVSTTCSARGQELADCQLSAPVGACTASLVDDRSEVCTRSNLGDRTVEECILVTDSSECRSTSDPPKVSLEHRVQAGEQTRIGHILVRGAFQSRDWVIISEIPMLDECEPERRRVNLRTSGFEPPETCTYDRELLLQGQSNIRALGLYDSVRMEVIGPDEDTNVATVVISVEETTTRFVEYRIGLDSRPTGQDSNQFRSTNELSYRDINFLGRGEELRLVGGFDFAIGEGRQVRDGEFDAELRAIYFDPRFYLFGALKKPWEGRLELAYEHELLPVAPAPQTKTISLEGVLRDSIRKFRGVFFEVGVSVRRTLTRDQSDDATSDDFEPSFILSVTPRVTIERRDNPLNPTKGYFGEIALEIADDFLGFLNSERFTSFRTRHSGYIPLGPFVLGLNGRLGVGFGGILDGFQRQGDLSLPLSERFFLGGVNSVRGLPTNGLDAVGTDEPGGDVFFNANIELRYPLIPSANLYGAVFVDAGQLAADITDFRFSETLLSGGIGIRWLIADIVPLVLDYGVILNREIGDDFGRLHFNIGYTF
jgi:outer membrane protein assembly factor BamA